MQPIDSTNAIVRLCASGMQAEYAGDPAAAQALFAQAWTAATDDYEACVAAHFVARHQPDPREALRWNEVALARAEASGDERVLGFFPSLYLNLGYAHECRGALAEARRCYALGRERLGVLDDGPYGDVVRGGLMAAWARVETMEGPTP